MCAHDKITTNKTHMPLDILKKIIDQSKTFKYPIHWFHHIGEPLLYPDLEEALSYFKKNGSGRGAIATNGLLLTSSLCDMLTKYCNHILIALDSTRPEVYKIVRNNNNFDLLVSNIKRLITISKDTELTIEIQLINSKFNQDETTKGFGNLFGIHDQVTYSQKRIFQVPDGNDLLPDYARPKTERNNNLNLCHHPLHHFVIKVNGDCVFCCYDFNGEQSIGNINNSNLLEIWEGMSASRLRHELKNNIFNNLTLCNRCPGWQQY